MRGDSKGRRPAEEARPCSPQIALQRTATSRAPRGTTRCVLDMSVCWHCWRLGWAGVLVDNPAHLFHRLHQLVHRRRLAPRGFTALQLIEHGQDVAEDRRADQVYLPPRRTRRVSGWPRPSWAEAELDCAVAVASPAVLTLVPAGCSLPERMARVAGGWPVVRPVGFGSVVGRRQRGVRCAR